MNRRAFCDLEQWYVKCAAAILFFLQWAPQAAAEDSEGGEPSEFAKALAQRQAPQVVPPPRISVFFVIRGGRPKKITDYIGKAGEPLMTSLGRVHTRFSWDRRYPDLVDRIAIATSWLECSRDRKGNRTVGMGSSQLVFYINGVAFADRSVKTAQIPQSKTVTILVSLEDYDRRKDTALAFLWILPRAQV